MWDAPSNTCVDWLDDGEFLASTHIDMAGINLWSDRTFYQTVHMDGTHPPMEPAQMDDPAPIAETSEGELEDIPSRAIPKTFAVTQDDKDEIKMMMI